MDEETPRRDRSCVEGVRQTQIEVWTHLLRSHVAIDGPT